MALASAIERAQTAAYERSSAYGHALGLFSLNRVMRRATCSICGTSVTYEVSQPQKMLLGLPLSYDCALMVLRVSDGSMSIPDKALQKRLRARYNRSLRRQS